MSDDVELTLESMAAAPIVQDYYLVPSIDFRCTITGTNRDTVTVQIFYVNTPMWSGTLTQIQSHLDFPTLQLGAFKISDGGLDLTVPTNTTPGNVMLSCTVTQRGQSPIPFSAPIASWPLTS